MSHDKNKAQEPTHLAITLTPIECTCGNCRTGAVVKAVISTPNKSTEVTEFLDKGPAKHLFGKMMELGGTATAMCAEAAPKNREEEAQGKTNVADVLSALLKRAGARQHSDVKPD